MLVFPEALKYIPKSLYLISSVSPRDPEIAGDRWRLNTIHDRALGKIAFPLYLRRGESALIYYARDIFKEFNQDKKVFLKEDSYQMLATSRVENYLPEVWEGTDRIVIETKNSIYVLEKVYDLLPGEWK